MQYGLFSASSKPAMEVWGEKGWMERRKSFLMSIFQPNLLIKHHAMFGCDMKIAFANYVGRKGQRRKWLELVRIIGCGESENQTSSGPSFWTAKICLNMWSARTQLLKHIKIKHWSLVLSSSLQRYNVWSHHRRYTIILNHLAWNNLQHFSKSVL